MPQLTDAQAIECFHLGFLQVLSGSSSGHEHILKGGTNLRYFFDSIRYSEDIDLDAAFEAGDGWKLAEKIDGILEGRQLEILLRTTGVAVAEYSKPKQTETTRRWKVQLQVPGQEDLRGTKIEFSNRNGDDRHEVEPVPDRFVELYGVRPPTVRHYLVAPAIEQKILALAERNATQTRDVFDLELLFRRDRYAVARGAVPALAVREAVNRTISLSFDAFQDQVIPFLDPEVAALYDKQAWNQIQAFVVDRLEELT